MKAQGQGTIAEVSQVERKIAQLMDRLLEADSTAVISAYEKHIGDLETERMILKERIEKCGMPLKSCEETFEDSMIFLTNLWQLEENIAIKHRQNVLKLAFADQLAY